MKTERSTVHINDDAGRIAMLEVANPDYTDDCADSLVRYIYSNHLGSSSLELDDSASIISYEEYHPYGTTSYQAMNAAINATAKRYRFTGKERDEESGLNYHGARYYIPWLCRWAAVDPLESKYAGWSSYNYGFCNPVKWNDPTGMGPDFTLVNPAPPRTSSVDNTGHAPIVPAPSANSSPTPPVKSATVRPANKTSRKDHTRVAPQSPTPAQKREAADYQMTDILVPDIYGNGHIGKPSVVDAQVQNISDGYYNQWSDNIRGGIFGALGSMAGGKNGSDDGAVIDGVVMSLAPNSGTPFGRTESIVQDPITINGAATEQVQMPLNNAGSSVILTPQLRKDYETEVANLSSKYFTMKLGGHSDEQIAITLHGLRRDLGVKYKALTPQPLRDEIYQRNIEKYGDKLGPSIDFLRNVRGKSWQDIIISSINPSGKDLDFNKP